MRLENRPVFPEKAVITGGMPYGNKDLHFGHIGGVFVPADIFARFMRDRIGRENVIFVSGTDCYGSPIIEYYRQLKEKSEFAGSLKDFVKLNHEKQKRSLKAYNIDLDLFSASAFGRAGIIHENLGADLLITLYKNNYLLKLSTLQFYDEKIQTFLNGRQVKGRCPIPGCRSEEAYADECSLGHPYEPKDLIGPRSSISGDIPSMREITNWYLDLIPFKPELEKWIKKAEKHPGARPFAIKAIEEFLSPPAIYIKKEHEDKLASVIKDLPGHVYEAEKGRPVKLIFDDLESREKANEILSSCYIRARKGKTLVPFRLTGNIEWGLKAPSLEGLTDLTFWVWPESLWAPISFTKAYLEMTERDESLWKDWWCSRKAGVYQFIGEDNVFFYGPAEMSIFMGLQHDGPAWDPPDGSLQLPSLIVNKHILFFDKKASSSGNITPPPALDLLNHYTSDQLRAHFFALSLGVNSVPFRPKPYNLNADPREGDPVLKEGNLLSNAFNRAVRSCFYFVQSNFNNILPEGIVSSHIKERSDELILKYEHLMFSQEFHTIMGLLDLYIRDINKLWSSNMKSSPGPEKEKQVLIDAFHMVRTAAQLMHPIAPEGTEVIREYLNIGDELWDWNFVFEPLSFFTSKIADHRLKHIEPRFDFFPKHPSQIKK